MTRREWTVEDLFRCPRCGVVPLVVNVDDGTGWTIELVCRCRQVRSRFLFEAAALMISAHIAEHSKTDGRKLWEILGLVGETGGGK